MQENTFLGSLPGDLQSHPGKPLKVHLQNTENFMSALLERYHISLDPILISTLGFTHDIAKMDPLFQAYLNGIGSGVNHAQRSAWFTYALTNHVWAAEAVCRHHTHLYNVEELLAQWMPNNVTWAKIQADMKKLFPQSSVLIEKEQFYNLEGTLFTINSAVSIDDWLLLKTLYSLLVTADRMDAIGISSLEPNIKVERSPYQFAGKNSAIDRWRADIQTECLKRAQLIDKPGVYTITLPTGGGKTFAGISIAEYLMQKFNATGIIYTLPFISIIEQTAGVLRDLFGEQTIQEDHSLVLAQNVQLGEQDSDNLWNRLTVLFRYWQQPIVITTLVHLWEVLFTSYANPNMNFHRLNRSVIIIDEPQGIPVKFWVEFDQVLNFLSERLGIFFILMTATQPYLPSSTPDHEIAPPSMTFPSIRHVYQVLPDKYDLDDLPILLKAHLPVERSGMVVLNTKQEALQAFKLVQEMYLGGEYFFLSGWLTPRDRKAALNKIKAAEKNDCQRYLITTQVVEAGVDLDFAWVFRDLAPLDSLIQVAGRCNRHGKDQIGKVLIAEMQNISSKSYCRLVYDTTFLDETRNILLAQFDEHDVNSLIDHYYKRLIQNRMANQVPLYSALNQGKWHQLPELIEKDLNQVTLYIEEDEAFSIILNTLLREKWDLTRRHEQKAWFSQLQQYAIQIPKKMLMDCRKIMSRFLTHDNHEPIYNVFDDNSWVLSKTAVNVSGGLYNSLLGFIPPEESIEDSFI